MAKSKIGGAFGFLKGSIGSVTYSTQRLGIARTRSQVARQKITEMINPNTVGQILQRMKLGPAQKFYKAFEEVVQNGIMSHSWEGVAYGEPSRLNFMSKALGGDPKVYVPKGINYFVPGEYEVSEGSLATIPVNEELAEEGENSSFYFGESVSAGVLETLTNAGLQVGDQLTLLFVVPFNGRYKALCCRQLVELGSDSFVGDYPPPGVWLGKQSQSDEMELCVGSAQPGSIAAVAVIVSRGIDSATALRSSATMKLLGEYKNLLSAEAMEAAIASYQNDVTYNDFNSDWYLNNGSSQAFNGKVITIDQVVTQSAGTEGGSDAQLDASFLVGATQSGGRLTYQIFTIDGSANGGVVTIDDEGHTIAARVDSTAINGASLRDSMVTDGLTVASGYMKLTQAITEQGGFIWQPDWT